MCNFLRRLWSFRKPKETDMTIEAAFANLKGKVAALLSYVGRVTAENASLKAENASLKSQIAADINGLADSIVVPGEFEPSNLG